MRPQDILRKMGGSLCSCARAPPKKRGGKAVSYDPVYTTVSRPIGHVACIRKQTSDMSSNDPLMTSSPGSGKTWNAYDRGQLATSQISFAESGISSRQSSIVEEDDTDIISAGSVPPSPEIGLVRKKAPPKPPRIKSYGESSNFVRECMSPSPSHCSNRRSPAPASDKEDLDQSLENIPRTPGGSISSSKGLPQTTQNRVEQLLFQCRDFLLYEIEPDPLTQYLHEKGAITARSKEEVRKCKTKKDMGEMLLDIMSKKGPKEFTAFCEGIRSVCNQDYIANMLTVLYQLLEIATDNKSSSAWNTCDSAYQSRISHDDSMRSTEQSQNCPFNNNNTDDVIIDSASFSFDIQYLDVETGHHLGAPEVMTIKRRHHRNKDTEKTATNVSLLGRYNSFRYIPVVSVSLYNQCMCHGAIELLSSFLRSSYCIRELSIAKCHIGLDGMTHLGRALEMNYSLVKLDIRLNTIGDMGAHHLAMGLRRNRSLKTLNVASTGLTASGCNQLIQGLARNVSLVELDIGFNDLRDAGARTLAEFIVLNCALKKLRMRDNCISADGGKCIFRALRKNCRLTTLDISSNKLGDEAMKVLAEMLLVNRTLKELNLDKCGVSKDGCLSIARALKTNTMLKMLDLSMNPVQDEGVIALADGLKYNHALDTLCVNMCQVGNRGFLKVLEALKFNDTLVTLKACYNNIGDTDAQTNGLYAPSIEQVYEVLCAILQLNKNLRVLLWGNKLQDSDGYPVMETP